MIVSPWHSTRLGETVYHNNTDCTEGNNIERRYMATGEGGLTLCTHCARLNSSVFFGNLFKTPPIGWNKR